MEKNILSTLKTQILNQYNDFDSLTANYPHFISSFRKNAIENFKNIGFPTIENEYWKNTELSKIINTNYLLSNAIKIDPNIDINQIFKCEIHNFETLFFANLNGYNLSQQAELYTFDNGVIAGSLNMAIKKYPDLIEKYFNKSNSTSYNGLTALNSALFEDGLFVYVPQNVKFETPLQFVNLILSNENILVNTRSLIILEKNSSLKFVQCDDSLKDNASFCNNVTEFHIADEAELHHYKLQNKDLTSLIINTSFFFVEENANVKSKIVTFNAGNIRNEQIINLNKENSKVDLSGLYLIDKTQNVDNHIFVKHLAPNCISNQTFKGILDEEATTVFTGCVYVGEGASKTEAYQSNKNILLSDQAGVMSKPFLEIYNDDVRCSHGSTVGQLDLDSMFYLQQRGICEKNSRLLMMNAFAYEVIQDISIEQLKSRIENMVHRRLKGELSSCDQCILHCSPNETPHFIIDESLL